jgi:hypothetical protein
MDKLMQVGKAYYPTDKWNPDGVELPEPMQIFVVTDIDAHGDVWTVNAKYDGQPPADAQGWHVCKDDALSTGEMKEAT